LLLLLIDTFLPPWYPLHRSIT